MLHRYWLTRTAAARNARHGWNAWTAYVESVFSAVPGCFSKSIKGISADEGGSRIQAAAARLNVRLQR